MDGEKDNRLGLKLRSVLLKHKLPLKTKTGTYEAPLSPKNIGLCLQDFWSTAAEHEGLGRIDHFWMYTDKPKTKQAMTKIKTNKKSLSKFVSMR